VKTAVNFGNTAIIMFEWSSVLRQAGHRYVGNANNGYV